MIQDLLERAKRGESVFLCDVRRAFAGAPRIICLAQTALGLQKRYPIPFPAAGDEEEAAFIREYFYAHMYNILSVLGGKRMRLYVHPQDTEALALCASLAEVFQVGLPRAQRSGYGKCLNVTDRVNAAMGLAPFSFEILTLPCPIPPDAPEQRTNAVSAFQMAVQAASHARLCGMDIGGTDIKVVGVADGRISAVKEYDWNPSVMTDIDAVMQPIILLTRVIRTAMALPSTSPLRQAMLDKDATEEDMREALSQAERRFGVPPLLDGVGVCFPDVVIGDKIVGGETLKTRGIREHAADYEAQFCRLSALQPLLARHCREGGVVHLANDGSLAAYTAAVELAHSPMAADVAAGVFAHTLGTEFGAGWIDEAGEIPQIPLELYNCIVDLGNYPARAFDVLDVRSINNFNTAIPGTLQKYGSQTGAYRLALQYFGNSGPYRELLSDFIEEQDGGAYVRTAPQDMRKPFLERIMAMAEDGVPEAEQVFREIGKYLAVAWQETEFLLSPRTRSRILFGRFIKRRRCFALMQQGAEEILPLELIAGDGGLAYTELMLQLKADPAHTVAQFGQAVGAAYFAASAL